MHAAYICLICKHIVIEITLMDCPSFEPEDEVTKWKNVVCFTVRCLKRNFRSSENCDVSTISVSRTHFYLLFKQF